MIIKFSVELMGFDGLPHYHEYGRSIITHGSGHQPFIQTLGDFGLGGLQNLPISTAAPIVNALFAKLEELPADAFGPHTLDIAFNTLTLFRAWLVTWPPDATLRIRAV